MKQSISNFFYTREGTRIFYTKNFEEDGDDSKPILVFIYGLVCSNLHWSMQLPFFDKLGFRILLHDFRAHFSSGGSDKVEDCTFANIVSDLYQLLCHIDPRGKFILISHSMGVNVALEFSKLHPEMVAGEVLISGAVVSPKEIMFDSNISEFTFPLVKWINKTVPQTFKFIWKYGYMNPLARMVVHTQGFNTNTVPEDFITVYMKRISELPPELFFKLIEEMENHDIINHLERIKTPSLIISGNKDKIIPNKYQQILHQYLENSEFYLVKNGCHVPQVDYPDSINERILLFISKLCHCP